ncbi:23S rRNA (pseudouridine(1915)-N(3))-methyltransferase RlmH [Fodinisporobacter ferrooxydans]|uniref:Ribosomal RNA large subunit methyltransferase H n=1 Tax=Fodinisporobacter ferrooxydans TaxID=2901836 RepID=A0ABY4CMI6_9BACL|nr:23S rRNA (pseudouridine(1915)-N(3))-methyltransferase RlmH [Alicyclobacillaceae bacterium MYW30-H2]
MQIAVIAVGKLKEKYWKSAWDEYAKRLHSYAKLQIIEVADEPAPEQLSEAQADQVKAKEAERILAHVKDRDYIITLEIKGKSFTSESFADHMDKIAQQGHGRLVFIIGGSLGLHDSVTKRSNTPLSFSAFTFPHQLMRCILIEQIYRAFRIMRGEPYHK